MKKIICFLFIILVATVSIAAAAKARSFYLTKDKFNGSHTLTACAEGYHMASFWEIVDVSNLRYDTTLGLTREDSGSGPPLGDGWIRTGYFASTANDAGLGNCQAWTTDSASANGSTVTLNGLWFNLVGNMWSAGALTCANNVNVWCVQD